MPPPFVASGSDQRDSPIEFGSLSAMARTLAEAFSAGLIFKDVDGYLELDDAAFADLAAEFNPAARCWRS